MVCWAAGSEGLVSFDEGSILTTSFRAAFSTCNPQRQWGRGLSRRVSLGAPGGREGGREVFSRWEATMAMAALRREGRRVIISPFARLAPAPSVAARSGIFCE